MCCRIRLADSSLAAVERSAARSRPSWYCRMPGLIPTGVEGLIEWLLATVSPTVRRHPGAVDGLKQDEARLAAARRAGLGTG